MKKLKKIVACAIIGAALAHTTVSYGTFSFTQFVKSRYGIGAGGAALIIVGRILSSMASQDRIALAEGAITDPSIITNERELAFYCHNAGSLILLLSIGAKCCAFLQLLHLLGGTEGIDAGDLGTFGGNVGG